MNAAIPVTAPPSKSVSHRAFICAALAQGVSRVSNALDSDDLIRTRACLTACGATFEETPEGWTITGVGRPRGGADIPADLNMGESGTSCRLLTAVAASGSGRFRIHGEGRMHSRPIGQLTGVLESQGARVSWEGTPGYPPFTLGTSGLAGGQASVPLDESSQYLSGLLLAAPLARTDMTVGLAGTKVVSWPYVSLTLMVMADFGRPVTVQTLQGGAWTDTPFGQVRDAAPGSLRFLVPVGKYQPKVYSVEGDWSNASYFLAAGAIGNAPVRVGGLRRDSLQGDRAMLDILERMGAAVTWDAGGVTVSRGRGLTGIEVDMGACPDLVPTVTVCAALATGRTVIRNVAHLRIKESDRLEACAAEAARVGARVETFADGLAIDPAPVPVGRRIPFKSYDDHRLAMSMSLFGLVGIKAAIDNPACVAKSFPGFWEERKKLG